MSRRTCQQCGERKELRSFYGPNPHNVICRACILQHRKSARPKKQRGSVRPGTRIVGGRHVTPEHQLVLRKKVEELGGRFAPTDVQGMIEFVKTHETATNILKEAQEIVDGKRRDDYGHPAENHARTAMMWSAYLGVKISPRQVCILNILQKCSRDAHSQIHDNLVDVAGWARNAQLCTPAEYPTEG